MTIEKIDGVWAETGDLGTEPTAAKKETGWVGNDQPLKTRFNYLTNRQDIAINDIIEERVNSYYDDATDAQKMLSTGLWDDSWGVTNDAANTISGGGTKEYRDLCVIFNSDNEPRLLVLDNANTKIEVWDPRTLAAAADYSTSDALTDDLPSGGTEVWVCVSMCTDGVSVYGFFTDTNATPDEHRIQAWDIATWDVKTGWPATGTQLTATGNANASSFSKDGSIIIASSAKLATVVCGQVIAADTDEAISIVDITNGSIDDEGSGDAPVATSAQATDNICSDGTNIYFVTYSAGDVISVCSASIADLSVGCGGANYADPGGYTLDAGYNGKLCACGPNLIANIIMGSSQGATDEILYTHNNTDAALQKFTYGQNSAGSPLAAYKYILEFPFSVVFDGINLWINGTTETGASDMHILIKIDVSKLHLYAVDDQQLSDIVTGAYVIAPGEGAPSSSVWQYLTTCFDGRDIWVNPEPRASQTLSGKLYRLPLALLRG